MAVVGKTTIPTTTADHHRPVGPSEDKTTVAAAKNLHIPTVAARNDTLLLGIIIIILATVHPRKMGDPDTWRGHGTMVTKVATAAAAASAVARETRDTGTLLPIPLQALLERRGGEKDKKAATTKDVRVLPSVVARMARRRISTVITAGAIRGPRDEAVAVTGTIITMSTDALRVEGTTGKSKRFHRHG